MAELLDGVVSEAKTYKGAARVVYASANADGGPTFPTKIEDVIDLSTFVLESGWSDIGGTTKDGITLTRGMEADEGVEVDQVTANILVGGPKKWSGRVGMTLVHTDYSTLAIAFETPTPVVVSGSQGSQYKVTVGTPPTLTERQMCIIQKHSQANKFRMIAVRRAFLRGEEMELAFKGDDATKVPIGFDMTPDTAQDSEDNLFQIFEMTSAI